MAFITTVVSLKNKRLLLNLYFAIQNNQIIIILLKSPFGGFRGSKPKLFTMKQQIITILKSPFGGFRGLFLSGSIGILLLSSCNTKTMSHTPYQWPDSVAAPIADVKPKQLVAHGDTRIDNYFWLNDYFKKGEDSTHVVNYLLAENKYYDTMMSGTKALQQQLYTEMKARIKETDESVPTFNNGYFYYTRLVEGKDYYVYCRKKGDLKATEEVLLDVNKMAEGHNYFNATGFSISKDNKLLAYGVDTLSRRQYTLHIKNLETGETLTDVVENTEGQAVWANDNKTFFYTAKNTITLLSEKIKRHNLGTTQAADVVVYTETDPSNYIGISKTKSDKYIIITSQATLSSECKFINANNPTDVFKVFQPRLKNVLYDVDHANDKFYVKTNLNALNFKIVQCPETTTDTSHWVDVIPHSDKILIQNFDVFKSFLAISERKDGLSQIHILNTTNNQSHYLAFDESSYVASLGSTPDFNAETVRFNYTSLITPSSVYDYNMNTKEKTLKKQQEVIGGYDKTQYITERLLATATDGTKIPISIVYKKGFQKNGKLPLHLYAYGSYGSSTEATFSSARLSMLNRGFAYAIAHIRGGEEMGRQWYEDGKMMKKKNTFTDFINCADYLITQQYTTKEHLYTSGGSAGGLLMGAVVNMRPELWHGVIAAVPFVDVISTMSDATIPLTTNEYDEWGNPANKESYEYMKTYSPYDNVTKQAYPNMLVTTGLHDSQVQYFEPAKWVAKLRALKTDNNKLLLFTNMEAGHGGASGRFKALLDRAREYAFFLALEGIHE